MLVLIQLEGLCKGDSDRRIWVPVTYPGGELRYAGLCYSCPVLPQLLSTLLYMLSVGSSYVVMYTFPVVFHQIISNDISELQKNQATTVAKIAQYKRKLMDLSHRVLQVCAIHYY